MIERIPQREMNDCTICVVAMALGTPFTYERVLRDSQAYPKMFPDGKFHAWWEVYIQQQGYRVTYRPFMDLYQLPRFSGKIVGLLGLDFPKLRASHIVCVDEVGVIDPADGSPPHIDVAEYVLDRREQGAIFHEEFLAVALTTEAG